MVRRQPARVDVQDHARELADEIDVVADEDERALVRLERADERVDAGHVEVRRRLVHQQEVRRVEKKLHERESALLAAAEHGDRFEHVVAGEQERAEHGARGLLGHRLGRVERLGEHGAFGIQHLDAVLGVVTGFHVQAELARAGLDRQDPREELEQRRFPRAVRADEHDPLAALGLEVHAPVDDVLTVRVMDVLQLDHAPAAALGLRELEADRAAIADGSLNLLHALDLLQLRLRLRGLRVLRAEAVGELLKLLDLLLLRPVRRELLRILLFALAEVVVVVAAEAHEPALADFHDAADELVEELAVVGDQQDRAGVRLQVALEPLQGLEIEVVRRLVEHQQVGLLDEQAREVRAHHPAAAHLAQPPVEVAFAERQSLENGFRARLEGVAAERLVARLHGVEIF